jgi:hypothetical protein
MTKNEMDQLVYADPNKLYDEFILCVEQNKINTSVPVANTNILYTTNFKSYYSASEHVLYHLNNIVNYKKPSQVATNDDPNEQ